jgi:phosphoribosylamine--glycine ligase
MRSATFGPTPGVRNTAALSRNAIALARSEGGSVLNVTASGKTVAEAQARAYEAVDRIRWLDGFCRRDIGWQAVAREKA